MTAGVSRIRARKVIPWLWLAMSLGWAVVIIATNQLAWPLALWVATTVGPLAYLNMQNDPAPEAQARKDSNNDYDNR